ncbi:MAG: flagellar hook-basal body complex protein FliE [Candidatus Gastranaerophilales bacterium]|nr:flagellar hook-basal body complex protein FliE [Candidatus Gastranaerophilales bacterium]
MNKINQVNFFQMKQIEPMQLNGNISINSNDTTTKSFKDVVSDLMVELNNVTEKPKELTNLAMQGKAEIHDVMSAIAQSEITVQAATTVTGKILQTYEKIMQIQI